MALVRWDPVREIDSLQGEMNRLFSTFFDTPARAANGTGTGARRWIPAMDLVETGEHFVLKADLPGMTEGDVNIEVENSVLTVSGERKTEHEDKQEGYYRLERATGAFSRSLTLPDGIDAASVTATFDNGVLQVRIPKPVADQAAQGADRHRQRRARDDRRRRRRRTARRRSPIVCGRMGALQILHRDPGSQARAGVLRVAHGEVRTPAFVPLATKGTVKGLEPREVAGLGYDMVLGNTFHLFLEPGAELIAHFGGLHEFMGWGGPIITDSGGFQVFSMGHGTVADEIKGRAPTGRDRMGASSRSTRRACASAPTSTAPSASWGRRRRWRCRPTLGSDIALVFDECTPFHVDREYTARSTERTHRWLDRCLDWHDEHGPRASSSTGSCRAASTRTCVSRRRAGGRGAAGGRDRDRRLARRRQGADVRGRRLGDRGAGGDERPRHLLGIGDIDDLIRGVELGIDTFDCAMPTRLGPPRHGDRARAGAAAGASTSTGARRKQARRADHGGLPVSGVRGRATRAATCTTCSPPRADGPAAGDAAQPRLRRAAHGGPARGDRRGHARRRARALRGGAAPPTCHARLAAPARRRQSACCPSIEPVQVWSTTSIGGCRRRRRGVMDRAAADVLADRANARERRRPTPARRAATASDPARAPLLGAGGGAARATAGRRAGVATRRRARRAARAGACGCEPPGRRAAQPGRARGRGRRRRASSIAVGGRRAMPRRGATAAPACSAARMSSALP